VKIAINATSADVGGGVTYLTNLLQHLPPPESGYQFFVFLRNERAKALTNIPRNIKLCPLPGKDSGGWRRLWWEQITLRRFLRRENIDALFSSANFAMFRCPVRQILLVRNTLFFSRLYQQMFLSRHSLRMRIAIRLRRWLTCRSATAADVVMTPTRAMLDELRGYAGVPDSKVLVNPYGVGRGMGSGRQNLDAKTTDRFGAKGKAIRLVYVSLYNEYKNLRTLLNALPLLNQSDSSKYFLTTTVDPSWQAVSWMVTVEEEQRLALQPDVRPWVTFIRPSDWRRTQPLYELADIFVFPSLTESFGHPLAEAMTHGLPIVAADTPVNREICGDAAVYFNPLSAEHLAQQVRGLAGDGALMKKLGAVGRERAAKLFRWDRHVQRILDFAGAPQESTPQAPAAH
jgi:glycosyltransferase involved in cell wall biosynthesis